MEELITPYERARRPLSQIPLQIWTVIHGSLKIADISHKTPTVAGVCPKDSVCYKYLLDMKINLQLLLP